MPVNHLTKGTIVHANPAFLERRASVATAPAELEPTAAPKIAPRVSVLWCEACGLTRAFTDGRCNICDGAEPLYARTRRTVAATPAPKLPTTRAAAVATLRTLELGATLTAAHVAALELVLAPAAKRTRAAKRPPVSRHVKAFQAMRFAGGNTCSTRDQDNADRCLGLAPSVVAAFRYRPADRAGVLELARVAS